MCLLVYAFSPHISDIILTKSCSTIISFSLDSTKSTVCKWVKVGHFRPGLPGLLVAQSFDTAASNF